MIVENKYFIKYSQPKLNDEKLVTNKDDKHFIPIA